MRNNWAHPSISENRIDAQRGLDDLRLLLRDVAAICQGFELPELPESFNRAKEVTDQQIKTLRDALRGAVPFMHVDLFSMTVVFFGRSLARYYDACVSCEPLLAPLLRDDVESQELKDFFSLATPHWQSVFQHDAPRNDDNDGGYSGGVRRPDPLTIVTTFMERRHKRHHTISQQFGQIPFFIMKLARNLVYHGTETPREMSLLTSACIESSLLIREIQSQRQDIDSSYRLYVEPTLKECRILLSWLTTAGGYGVDLAPLLHAAVCNASIPVDENHLYSDLPGSSNAFEKLRRIISDDAPLVCSYPRLFVSENPDFCRLVQNFNPNEYRNEKLRNTIRHVTGIDIYENDDIDAILKRWLLANVIPEDRRENCLQYSAADLLRRELAWLLQPVFRHMQPSISYSFGFHHMSTSEKSSLQKLFRERFHHFPAELTCAQAVPIRRKFEYLYSIEILPPSVDEIRFDLISMMLIMGADSDSLGTHLSEWTVPMENDDIGRHGLGGFSTDPLPSVIMNAFHAGNAIQIAQSYLMENEHTSHRRMIRFSFFCQQKRILDAFHPEVRSIKKILETRPDLFAFHDSGGKLGLYLKVQKQDDTPRKQLGGDAGTFDDVKKPGIVEKLGSFALQTKLQELLQRLGIADMPSEKQKLWIQKSAELWKLVPDKEDRRLLHEGNSQADTANLWLELLPQMLALLMT
jgi:hypothetical protein